MPDPLARQIALCALALALSGAAPAAEPPPAELLLGDADRARGGLKSGITWEVKVTSTEDGERSERAFLVKARGDDALAETLAPPRSKGELLLFNDRTIWFVKPGLRKPVSISARQKLSGQLANGDIATTHYARDYEGTVAGEEKVGETETWRLELKARAKNVTYDRIRYWVSKDKRLGVKAEFLTLDGRPFKAATFEYGHRAVLEGSTYDVVSRMVVADATFPENISVIEYGTPRPEEHAPSLFNVNNVVR